MTPINWWSQPRGNVFHPGYVCLKIKLSDEVDTSRTNVEHPSGEILGDLESELEVPYQPHGSSVKIKEEIVESPSYVEAPRDDFRTVGSIYVPVDERSSNTEIS